MNDPLPNLDGFSGVARLFPLPNLVFFPHVMQPLHIFEPRYRQMTADALADDKIIALVLPRPGWDEDYEGKFAIHDIACVGKIIADQKLEDGRFNLLLRGMSRARILGEIDHDRLYRSAHVELLDEDPMDDSVAESRYRQQLLELAPRLFPQPGKVKDEFRKLLMGPLPLGSLCDIVAFALPLPPAFKQALLEELDVERRLAKLTEHLKEHVPPASISSEKKFPPEFSEN